MTVTSPTAGAAEASGGTNSADTTSANPVSERPCVSGAEAANILGLTYRRIDHHLRSIGTLEGTDTPGSGHPRCLTKDDLFAIAMVALIRENVGSQMDFKALLPRLYRAYGENARIVLDTVDSAVTVVVDGTEVRDHIHANWPVEETEGQ